MALGNLGSIQSAYAKRAGVGPKPEAKAKTKAKAKKAVPKVEETPVADEE